MIKEALRKLQGYFKHHRYCALLFPLTTALLIVSFQNCAQKTQIIGFIFPGSGTSGSSDCSGTANLTWVAPTQNTDGSSLTDLAGYKLSYGTSSGNYGKVIDIPNASATAYTVVLSTVGTYYFAMQAYNSSGSVSAYSGEVSKIYSKCGSSLLIDLSGRTVALSDTYPAGAR